MFRLINSYFRCLIFASDGLWNVIDPEFSVDSVYETERRNDQNSKLGINQWRNPSRVLVEAALEKWRSNGLRADNTSVVCVMLDPPNKRNMFKFCRSPAVNAETIETLECARTIFDYSTSEAYNLDCVGSETYSSEGLVRQNASYDLLNQTQNSFYSHHLASNVGGQYFQTPGSHQNYSSGYDSYDSYGYQMASTSTQHQQVQPGSLTYQTSSNESAFVKACCRNNYLLARANEQIPYHSSYEHHRKMYESMASRPYPPLHYAYRPVPTSQQLPLPSLHANVYDHHGYLQSSYKPMERYNYLRPTPEEVAALHNEDDETESDSNAMDFSDEESEDEETEKKETEPLPTTSTVKESDDSIQIFEITSSSFHANEGTAHNMKDSEATQFQKKPAKSNNKENSEGSPRKKKALTVTRGRIYLTRQTDRKMRSSNTGGVTRTIGKEKLQRRMTRNIRKVVKTTNDQRPSTCSKTLPEIARGAKKLIVKVSENKPVEKEAQKPTTLKVRVLRSADTTFKKQSNDEIATEVVSIRSLRSNSSNVMENVERPATRKRTSNLFDNIERNKHRRLK